MTRRPVQLGDRGVNVRYIQRRLLAHGLSPGPVDGVFGAKTAAALGRFLQRGADCFAPVRFVGPEIYAQLESEPQRRAEGAEPPESPALGDLADRGAGGPRGLGAFVSALGVQTTGTPEQFGAQIERARLGWVAILRVWQESDGLDKNWNAVASKVAPYIQAAKDAGAEVYVWGWAVPGKAKQFAASMASAVRAWGAVGVIADCEEPWRGAKPAEAAFFCESVRAALSQGVRFGVTSYYSTKFPLVSLSAGADFIVPQIYDSKNNLGPDYPADALANWQKANPRNVVVIPAFKSYNTTPEQMATMLERLGAHPALALWQWRTTSAAEWAVLEALPLV